MERQGETGKEQAFHMDSRQKQEESGMDNQQKQGSLITDYGQITLSKNRYHHRIHLLNIIGEIEGHENLGSSSKTSKYEHILPQLAAVEDDEGIDGLMVLLNTVGGDVEAGLAIAEMIASLSKPKVCLVLGGGHWRAVGSIRGCDVYCAVGNDGRASDPDEWNRAWCDTELRIY